MFDRSWDMSAKMENFIQNYWADRKPKNFRACQAPRGRRQASRLSPLRHLLAPSLCPRAVLLALLCLDDRGGRSP